jgi:Glycosyltransferase family 87
VRLTRENAARTLAWLAAPLMLAAMMAIYGVARDTYYMGDFRAFYCAGSAISHGANPYLEEPLRTCEATSGPPFEPAFLHGVAVPAPLPPYALLAFAPLAALPFWLAAALFALASCAAMVAAVVLLQRVTGASSIRLNLSLAAITGTVTLYVGQPMPFVFAALAAAALLARHGKWTWAALCVAAASIEPHVALPAIVGIMAVSARARFTLVWCGLAFAVASTVGLGFPVTVSYVRDVLPAHALANAYEWQFSLTSILTSLGVAAPSAIRAGELMFAAMIVLGVVVAHRWRALTGDAALMVIVPPAFAVLGGVHVHFQQIAVAFPALLYAIVRYPRVRTWAAGGLIFAMLPWNVLGSTLLSGCAPLLAGTLGAHVLGRRAGLVAAVCAAAVVLSLLLFALVGLGPPPVHFVPRVYPGNALAELSWGDFSHLSLMRPSLMMQWLRVPTMLGLAFGLAALVRIAFDAALLRRRATIAAPEIAPAGAR